MDALYYSNVIEGQQTRVRDIEPALQKDFAAAPKQRELQQLSLAHLEVQRWAAAQTSSPFAVDFIRELHRRFYAELPETMRRATTANGDKAQLTPGELRDHDVKVGTHIGPPHEIVPALLDLDGLARRIEHYARVVDAQVAPEADRVFLLLREALLRGEFPRGEAARIVNASGRTVLTLAVEAGLLVSDTPKSPLRLGLPAKVHETYFPQLFPVDQVTGNVG